MSSSSAKHRMRNVHRQQSAIPAKRAWRRGRSLVNPAKDYISRLPDELLLYILDAASTTNRVSSGLKYKLTLVNRRFYRLANPILYRSLIVEKNDIGDDGHGGRYLELVHRALRENTLLRSLCRTVYFKINESLDIKASDVLLLKDISSWLTEVASLAVYEGFNHFDKSTWFLTRRALARMPLLRTISLRQEEGERGLCISQIMKEMASLLPRLEHLEKLYINGITENEEDEEDDYDSEADEIYYAMVDDDVDDEVDSSISEGENNATNSISPLKYRYTAPFTHLHLGEVEAEIPTLTQLLYWPKTLLYFTLDGGINDFDEMTLANIGQMLSHRKESLETISINYPIPYGGLDDDMIDLREFRNLKQLRMSRWCFESDETMLFRFGTERKLLAPLLQEFTWDFASGNWYGGAKWMEFGQNEARWVKGFALLAKKSNCCTLSEIHIDVGSEGYRMKSCSTYPWDNLDETRDEIAQYGIKLYYSAPTFTKDDWITRQYVLGKEVGY